MQEIYQYLKMFRNGWWVIALSTLAAFNITLTLTYFETPMYRTSARFLVTPTENLLEYRDFMSAMNPLREESLTATYAEILQSNSIFSQAIETLNIEPTVVEEYEHRAVVLPQSNVLELFVSGSNPELVANLANTVGYQSITYIEDVYPIFDLRVLDEAIVPDTPYAPNPKRDAMIAGVLGFILGIGILLVVAKIQSILQLVKIQNDSEDSSQNPLVSVES